MTSLPSITRSEHRIIDELGDIDAKRIAQMDRTGIDVQVLSFASPGPQAFAAKEAVPMARDANDRLCAAVKRHPSRFAGFAALPTADPAAAAQELERTDSIDEITSPHRPPPKAQNKAS